METVLEMNDLCALGLQRILSLARNFVQCIKFSQKTPLQKLISKINKLLDLNEAYIENIIMILMSLTISTFGSLSKRGVGLHILGHVKKSFNKDYLIKTILL